MQRYYFLLENMYRAMMIFWLTCLVGYPRTSAPEPIFSVIAVMFILFTFSVMYSGEDYYGLEKGLGFYLTSAILLVLLVIIKIGIAISLWE